jgi:hypothetical protein
MSHRSRATLPLLATLLAVLLIGCSAAAAPSFDPTGVCTTDGAAPGSYPELEAFVPKVFQDAAPERVDSGRNCSATNLGSLVQGGFTEIRFAGGTWSFGAERAAVLAVFTAKGLTADLLGDFYANSARTANKTQILAESSPTIGGRPGRRLDTQTGERLQTVVVWPSKDPDRVNVVITNDLPDPRIQDAIAAFGAG